jgi:type II secretion system protein N
MGWCGRFRLFFQGLGATLCAVKKVSKAILVGLGVLLALGIALLVSLNLYIQSPGAQARIQEELSRALRLPLKLTNTSVTPGGDLRITGISIPNGAANFLDATSFTAHYRLFPLVEGKLIITEMIVESPKILWVQSADGKWKLPGSEEAAEISKEQSATAIEKTTPSTETALPVAPKEENVPVETPKIGTPATTAAVKQEEKSPVKPAKFAVIIQRFDVKNGAIELLDSAHKHVAVLTDVNMTYTTLSAERVEGTAQIGKAVWADGLTLENVRTPFLYAADEFALPALSATIGGGTLQGTYQSQLHDGNTTYNATGKFAQVDVSALVRPEPGKETQAHGELAGEFETKGDTRRPEKAEGRGHLDLRNGQFSQLELFQNIGSVLGLRELSDLRVKDGHAELRLSGDKIYVERLLLNTADLQLSSKGTVRLDQKVNLEAQLSVEDALVKQLPAMTRDSFATTDGGRRTIDFTITGTTEKLKTNLLDKFIGQKINAQFGDLLGGLFGSEKKPEDDKKKKEEEDRKKTEKKTEKERKKKEKSTASDAAPTNTAPATPPNP